MKTKYYKTLKAAIENSPKGSIILFDDLDNKIIVNPNKLDFLRAFGRSKQYFFEQNKKENK